MNALLSPKANILEKQRGMHDEFRISMTKELESKASDKSKMPRDHSTRLRKSGQEVFNLLPAFLLTPRSGCPAGSSYNRL
jgi:hypothetical protein